MWTAPSAGTGRVTFRYAAVQARMTYWGNQEAGVVQGMCICSKRALTDNMQLIIYNIILVHFTHPTVCASTC